jgi:hypothetical protein
MSFRLFIFYCCLCGAWAALVGWALGRQPLLESDILQNGVKALCLGLFVALALAIVDTLWNFSLRQVVQVLLRVLIVVLIGGAGGLVGGVLSQSLYGPTEQKVFLVGGWTLTGLLIGASIGAYDYLSSVLLGRDRRGARRKLLNGLIGGAAGGVLGGMLYELLKGAWSDLFRGKSEDAELWSPSALGFVVLGACIGLLIGLAQVILKEAWVKVEAGKRAGRELILSKPETTIGRAEACDIGLFGDTAIERLHARILLQNGRYHLADAGTANGTFVNDHRVDHSTLLHSGDVIRLGSYVLRFGERRKNG